MEMFSLDFNREVEDLKTNLECVKCHDLGKDAKIIFTCNHILCKKCLNKANLLCPKCQANFASRDVQKCDIFVQKSLNFIEKINGNLSFNNIPANFKDVLMKSAKLPPKQVFKENNHNKNEESNKQTKRIVTKIKEKASTSKNITSSQIATESKNKFLTSMIGVVPEYNDNDEFQCEEIGRNYIKVIQSVMKKNPKGETPLHLACKKGNVETVQKLISCGVDLNAVDFANFTPLHEAVQSNTITCMELLLLNGALPNVPAQNYRTPLHEAVELERAIMIELLLTYGADKTVVDCFGKSPKDLCKSDEIKKILQNTKANENVPKLLYSGDKNYHSLGVPGFYIDVLHTFHWSYCKTLDNVRLLTIGMDVSAYNMIVLEAILKGVMIIRDNFIHEYAYMNRPIYPEFISKELRHPVLASIKNNLNKLPKLFDGMKFHVLNHSKGFKINNISYKKEDLINLIKAGGGKILQRAPAERTAENAMFWPYHTQVSEKLHCCSNYIVYEIGNQPLLMYNMTELRHVSSEWLIDCVLKFKIDF